ncbi:hypothetical protein B0H13DRAFT_556 [Mycena leptocephala]|nr:hypothetical protein B0H13DRAFT_556 [Mycena leptocephala]
MVGPTLWEFLHDVIIILWMSTPAASDDRVVMRECAEDSDGRQFDLMARVDKQLGHLYWEAGREEAKGLLEDDKVFSIVRLPSG